MTVDVNKNTEVDIDVYQINPFKKTDARTINKKTRSLSSHMEKFKNS